VNPIVTPRLENNRLSFQNAAVAADVAKAPDVYRASWFHFDNATGESRSLSETTSATTTIEAPPGLPAAPGGFILVEISADSKEHKAWQRPVRTYFRLDADGWKLVGLDRMPDRQAPAQDAGRHASRPHAHSALPRTCRSTASSRGETVGNLRNEFRPRKAHHGSR